MIAVSGREKLRVTKERFIRLGRLEASVDGEIVDKAIVSKNGQFAIKESQYLQSGKYFMELEELIALYRRRIRQEYTPKGIKGLFNRPKVEINYIRNGIKS